MARGHVIDRVLLRGSAFADAAAGRAWSQRALAAADLDDVVSPAATLVLREVALTDAHPGALRRAACDAARGAVRPAAGPVGAGAAAVLFADDGELLACMARDLLGGTFAAAWWWAAQRRAGGAPAAVVARAWVQRPLAAPAALAALARTGHAGALLLALAPPALRELAGGAATAGLLPAEIVRSVLAPQEGGPGPTPGGEARRAGAGTATTAAAVPRAVRMAARDIAPASGAAGVLGAALLLAHRAPAVLPATSPAALAQAVATALVEPLSEPTAVPPPRASPAGREAHAPPPPAPPATTPVASRSPRRAINERRRAHGAPPRRAVATETGTDTAAAAQIAPQRGRAGEPGPAASVEPGPGATAPAVRTPLAGAFMLLTVAQDLGLYADFTRPRDRGLAISPWTWLAHTTAQLVGVRDPHDPLWGLLAALAGDPPGPPPGRAPQLRPLTRRVARRLDGALERRGSARGVILREGAVQAGAVRVDVVFGLEALDVAIRRCGLDRDPGWLPAAARDIRLHYR